METPAPSVNPAENELRLIAMVQKVIEQQQKYFSEKKKYGSSPTQLKICQQLERDLSKYCKERKLEIENKQASLF